MKSLRNHRLHRPVVLILAVSAIVAAAPCPAQTANPLPIPAALPEDRAGLEKIMATLASLAAPDPPAVDEDLTFGEKMQKAADDAFGVINNRVIPILFFDVSFGLFDPSLEAVKDQLGQVRSRLETAPQPDQPDYDAETAFLLQRQQDVLAGHERTLEAKTDAILNVPRAWRAIEAYRALPERDDELLDRARAGLKVLGGQSSARITAVPLIVIVLLLGGIFFTFRYGFVHLRLFAHSIQVIRGKYDNPKDHGEISHFQALTSALSATVGLGNIAGVAVAIAAGGAGAVFWMWVVAFFGMSAKFSSCALAQVYRRVKEEDAVTHSEHILGGPMVYLSDGMKEMLGNTIGGPFGKLLAITFAFFAITGSLGGANLFQGQQTFAIVGDVVFQQRVEQEDALLERVENGDAAAARELREARKQAAAEKDTMKKSYAWVGGMVMTILVGIVIVGGIKRIGEVTSKLVPAMCLFYVGVCLIIVIFNYEVVPRLLASIFEGAFTGRAMAWGGIMGVLVTGVKRGAFSNEAGLGSAAIAHSAAKTQEPIREGVVAMIGPFIDTIVVCTMTALAILITGAHLSDATGEFSNEGVGITATAFSSLAPWLSYLLTIAVFIFAYSTMISWSYYGERASEYLFGRLGIWPYRIVFLFFVFISPMVTLDNVILFTDLLILSMAYPNILGMIILSPKLARLTKDYVHRLRSGQMKPYAEVQAQIENEPSI